MQELSELSRLIGENQTRLLRYAGRYLREPQDARDAVQEAFIKLARAMQAGLVIDNAEAWLFKVLRNRCFDFLKSKRLKVEVSLEVGFDFSNDGVGSPDTEASAMDDIKMLKCLVQGLSANEREIICLKLEHGKSYKEIAEIAGLSVSNVGFILHNAMKKMQKAYRELESSPQLAAAIQKPALSEGR